MSTHRQGALLKWNWASGTAVGRVKESFIDKVTRIIKGKSITRNASAEEPAYLMETPAGDQALKSHSELSAVSKSALLGEARKQGVEGRSKMSVDQLQEALF